MSIERHFTDRDQNARRMRISSLGYILATIFSGTLVTGVLVTLGFSASGCLLSRAIRCFSFSRDFVGLVLLGLKMWSLPALIAALLTTMIVQSRGSVAWWIIVFVAPGSMLVSGVLLPVEADFAEISVLFPTSLVLFVGIQLSRMVRNRFSDYPI